MKFSQCSKWTGFAAAGLMLISGADCFSIPVFQIASMEGAAAPMMLARARPIAIRNGITLVAIEPESNRKNRKQIAWLGVSTEEAPEVLTSQLGLQPGAGLLVTYIAVDSPAAKAGLQKNDVLVELEDQLLVYPAQLRKLVRMHKEGDVVKLEYFRSGKKDSVSATLGKTEMAAASEADEDAKNMHRFFGQMKVGDGVREQMQALHQSLSDAGIDQAKLNNEIHRSIEEITRAIQEAIRSATNAHSSLGPAARELEALAGSGVGVGKDATVTIKKDQKSVKTMVKTDDSGSFVIVANPKRHLTTHDKDGKLTFDGPIETPEDQKKVPRDLWPKVKEMLDEMGPVTGEKPEADARPAEGERKL